MALWKNRVPTKSTTRASASIDLDFYLNALNSNNSPVSSSQNNVSYASVGAGLTDDEVYTYYELVDNLQTGLGRSKSTNPNAFITTWDTRISGTGTISNTSSIVLPLYGTQAITASWGDGTVSLISSSAQVDRTHSYATPGVYTVSITGTGQGFRFNNGGDRNKLMDIGQWGSISGSADAGFYGSSNLVGTAADALTIETTSLSSAFQNATRFNGYLNNWRPISCSNFTNMFVGATTFNQPIGNWPLSASSINMQAMLSSATSFNQNIGSWDVSKVTNMRDMFLLATNFNNSGSDSINNWRPISCSNFQAMFYGPIAFNQPIGNWSISASNINMSVMFTNAQVFNQNIGSWDVSKVTTMSEMFKSATAFNNSGSNSINNWRPISCSNFTSMFQSATAFNQPIGNWPISASSINISSMFQSATAFNQNIGSWDTSRIANMSYAFASATSFNNSGSSTIGSWNTSNVTSMFEMLSSTPFNQPIGTWNTSKVTSMAGMFRSTTAFNQNIGAWNVEKVTGMNSMFQQATSFNNSGSSDINNWRPISCSNFSSMFQSAGAFNQPIGNWTLGTGSQIPVGGINMTNMFANANNFNRNIGLWDVSAVTSMERMFQTNTAFNNSGSSDINNWNVSRVTNFLAMFDAASSFNQPLGNWNTISASRMDYMFKASPFNQPIGNWNVSNVILMDYMFENNSAFNQDIGSWNVSKVTGFTNFMAGKTAANYSFLHTIYDGWINYKLQPQRTISFGSIKYSGSAAEGRALLSRTYNTASITGYSNDGGFIAITCSVNHNVIVGNKIFMSGSSFAGINGVQTVAVVGSPTTLTLNTIYDPTATGGTAITGYGWSITDGGVV
jgi:surface protein